MPVLVWDQIGDRFYEAGVSKGVFYAEDGFGVPWNGLMSVEEDSVNEVEEFFFDGVKFNDVVTVGDFKGSIKAITYPDEMLEYEGSDQDQTGFFLMNQYPKKFSISYRTEIGDDVSGFGGAYKLHLLYNLTAIPSSREYESFGLDDDPIEFEWSISAVPEQIYGYKPTAHVIFDSRKIDPLLLMDIEDILYGSSENASYLPPLQSLATFIRKWDRLIIIDNGDGTWTAVSNAPGVIEMLDANTFQIVSDTATYLDANTYEISSSEKNEEDIWLP